MYKVEQSLHEVPISFQLHDDESEMIGSNDKNILLSYHWQIQIKVKITFFFKSKYQPSIHPSGLAVAPARVHCGVDK